MFTSPNTMKIKTIGQIIAGVLFMVAVGVVVVSVFAVRETYHMANTWETLSAGPAQKTIALGKLRGALGYGGSIHEFKDFVIRRDRKRIVNINIALLDVSVALTAYRSFGANSAEQKALSDLDDVLKRYSAAILLAERMVSNNATIIDVDKAVNIDDAPAILALDTLDRELKAARDHTSRDVQASISRVRALAINEAVAVSVLIGVLIAVFLWFIVGQLIRPISSLSKAMTHLEISSVQDIGDLNQRIDTTGPREISELAIAFKNMATKLAVAADKEHELQTDLLEAQKHEAVGHLAGGIAHEINTPSQYIGDNLNFLTGAQDDVFTLIDKSLTVVDAVREREEFSKMTDQVDTLRDELDFDYLREEIPSATKQSLVGIQQISRIVLAMKEFSHPGSKEKSLTDINRSLENTITISRNQWKLIAELTTDFEEKLPAIPCLAGELNQVFLNLIINAADAINDKPIRQGLGAIHVSTVTNNGHVVIRVRDDGAGIPKKIQDQVFNHFFTTKKVGAGSGQGLAISRDIVVKKHGGSINFNSEEGVGTTFIIRLPKERVENSDLENCPPTIEAESRQHVGNP